MRATRDALAVPVAGFASRCAAKLRKQRSMAQFVTVFMSTNPFREEQDQMSLGRTVALPAPAQSDTEIVHAALEALDACIEASKRKLSEYYAEYQNEPQTIGLRPADFQWKRAGVIVSGIVADAEVQTSFLDIPPVLKEKLQRLSAVADNDQCPPRRRIYPSGSSSPSA